MKAKDQKTNKQKELRTKELGLKVITLYVHWS